ncbi:hypothetical protein [Shinella sp.]|uniref:hypothetical protein n=1 Tax=Shinella sp. TaxID=1870904 RepID=UPI00225D263A|nr:hypothetical protein [Shinella sp.]MCW5709382.1 hypothetical protein [Shinella sp.]CAI0334646.1 hypothetical protein SHINE37_110373 [Rhizobiaceae bacterium]
MRLKRTLKETPQYSNADRTRLAGTGSAQQMSGKTRLHGSRRENRALAIGKIEQSSLRRT